MIISHNISALNANNQLRRTNTNLSKTMEKLSSGLRINRASDDAAGLAISEKMRVQINGLRQASRNIQDGISLIQTADGYLSNITDALQRAGTLITQRDNGIYSNSDKAKINSEIVHLLDHIEHVVNNSEFNGIPLFDGSFTNISIYGGYEIPLNINNMDLGLLYKENFDDKNKFDQWESDAGSWSIEDGELKQSMQGIGDKTILSKVITGNDMTITVSSKFTTIDENGNIGIIIKGDDFNNQVFGWYSQYGGLYLGERINGVYRNIGLIAVEEANINQEYKLRASVVGDYYTFEVEGVGRIEGYSANSSLEEGYTGLFTAFSEASFDNYEVVPHISIDDIQNSLNKVLSERAKLGAYQNRLEHTLNNVQNSIENLSVSESRIRDADMAKEMMKLTQNQILANAGQTMLAQANALPNTVLQLLQ